MNEIGEASIPLNESTKLCQSSSVGGTNSDAQWNESAADLPEAVLSSVSLSNNGSNHPMLLQLPSSQTPDNPNSTVTARLKFWQPIFRNLSNSFPSVIIGILAVSIVLFVGNGTMFERGPQAPSWQSFEQEQVWNLLWGKKESMTSLEPLQLKKKGSSSNSKLVIAGKMSIIDGPCNIAELDLQSGEWSLKERIQLSLYNSYSGGEVYYLLANHTSAHRHGDDDSR